MEAALYLSEAPQPSMILQDIRSELTSAVRTALVRHAYDTDVQLSFGTIHINSKGSVSQISFNGADVKDQEAFIVKQAFHISDNQYFDIRTRIKDEPDSFYFYPILIRDKISFTVLKSSPYFENRYGSVIHDESVRVEYASKYMLIYRSDSETPDYLLGLLNSNVLKFYWTQKFADDRKQFPKIKGTYIEQLPIRCNSDFESKIISVVKRIMSNPNEITQEDLAELNDYVYQVYGIEKEYQNNIEESLAKIENE